jgi:hypothetical protein
MTHRSRSRIASLGFLFSLASAALAQHAPKIQWQHCYGGSDLENCRQFIIPHDHMMVHTSDGGYAFVAQTNSYDAPVTGNHHDTTANPTFDLWLVKTDGEGNIQWEKCFGGSSDESPCCLIQTSDGGFAMCGTTRSHDGDVTDNHPNGSNDPLMYVNDAWIVKTDATGQKQWAHCYGWEHGDEYLNSIIEVNDGYVAVGFSTTVDGAPEGHVLDSKLNQGDALVLKLDPNGVEQWHWLYGSVNKDEAYDVLPFPSGGYIFAGAFGGMGPFSVPWVVRLDTAGVIVWQKTPHDSKLGLANTIIRTQAGFLLTGWTMPDTLKWDWDSAATQDGLAFTIDTSGKLLNFQRFGGSGNDVITSVAQATDGNFIFAGATTSLQVPGIHIAVNVDTLRHNVDSTDGWLGCFTPDLKLLWQKAMGGDFRDYFYTVLANQDQTIMVYGSAESGNKLDGGNGDHPGLIHGYADAWLLKMYPPSNGVAEYVRTTNDNAYPNPAPNEVYLNLLHEASVAKVQFFDLLGSEVFPSYRMEGMHVVANVQQLPAGVYEIKISYSNGDTQVRKFLHSGF